MTSPPGRRERKKAATRQALADAALELFLQRGFDAVTVAEVAEAADVSVTTLFKHFPSKEALLFDRDDAQERDLVAAVRERGPGVDLLDGLRGFLAARIGSLQDAHVHRLDGAESDLVRLRRFSELARSTPGLREYARRMWARHEHALARAIADELGQDEPSPQVRALAHIVTDLPGFLLAAEVPALERLDGVFALLRHGWAGRDHPR